MKSIRFSASIFLKDKKAVKGFKDDTVIAEDPVRLAIKYCDSGCDEIIIWDKSETDEQHEASLDMIKEICESIDIPVVGAGNVKRMEDIKKLLYAGCAKGVLNYSKEDNVEITEEVSKKFGKDKIMVCAGSCEEISGSRADLIKKYADGIIYMDAKTVREALEITPVGIMAMLPEVSLDKILNISAENKVIGIAGDVISDNADDLEKIKTLLEENGIETSKRKIMVSWDELKKNSDSLVPVVVQDVHTSEVLMLAYMNEEAYNATLNTGRMTYFSRSRQSQWIKGETSGHFQYLQSLSVDCDKDTLLAKVTQIGAACHTGNKSCFYTPVYEKNINVKDNPLKVFEDVFDVIKDRKIHPKEGSYTNYLFDKGIDKILKKVGEEATEIVIAAKNPNPNEIKYEISDFLYHCMVLMAEKDITWEDITEELARR
ncbi:MAG: bifunctional phosphoribosyl-AMP cyclohydrolase/phosphoribosyl-ATP diphosphatase HisIE [Lachnospiraceae bacterium]|nr:bifunctional phosphoribosyl-AMP cyclohydrolase/phosphoribosyl-ATP diphosphatase HisIE [Lachnospiraceae bacterium]